MESPMSPTVPPEESSPALLPPTARDRILAAAHFLRTCYIDGGRALIEGRFSRRQGLLVALSTLPAILGLLFLTLPGILFPTPSHNAFFHFANSITDNPASLLPTLLGVVSATLGLRITLSEG